MRILITLKQPEIRPLTALQVETKAMFSHKVGENPKYIPVIMLD